MCMYLYVYVFVCLCFLLQLLLLTSFHANLRKLTHTYTNTYTNTQIHRYLRIIYKKFIQEGYYIRYINRRQIKPEVVECLSCDDILIAHGGIDHGKYKYEYEYQYEYQCLDVDIDIVVELS
jgi:hypothetical protein